MSVAFDTLKAARRLGAAGFTPEQAETIADTFAEGITENLATKDDIALLQKDMKALDQKIDNSVEALDRKIDTSVEALHKDMKALDQKIDTSVEALHKDMKALDQKIDTSVEALHKDMKALDQKIDTSVEALRKDMFALKKDMTILLGSIMVGGIVVITLLDRVLAN